MHRAANADKIKWIDGKPYEFNIAFDNGEPNASNSEDTCYCVHVVTHNYLDLKLKDEKCHETATYLCQISGKDFFLVLLYIVIKLWF